jgi:hypothetical protein
VLQENRVMNLYVSENELDRLKSSATGLKKD